MTLRSTPQSRFVLEGFFKKMKKLAILFLCLPLLLCSCADLGRIGKSQEDTVPRLVRQNADFRIDQIGKRYFLTIIDGEGKEKPYMYFDEIPKIEKTESGILVVNDGSKIILFDPVSGKVSDDFPVDQFYAYNDDHFIAADYLGVKLYSMSELGGGRLIVGTDRFKISEPVEAAFSGDGGSFTLTYTSKESGERVTETFSVEEETFEEKTE